MDWEQTKRMDTTEQSNPMLSLSFRQNDSRLATSRMNGLDMEFTSFCIMKKQIGGLDAKPVGFRRKKLY